MSKMADLTLAAAANNGDEEMMMDFMGGAMKEVSASMQTQQGTALELTKLALSCTKNPSEEDVFDLFERAASVVSDIYQLPFGEDMAD